MWSPNWFIGTGDSSLLGGSRATFTDVYSGTEQKTWLWVPGWKKRGIYISTWITLSFMLDYVYTSLLKEYENPEH